MTDDRVVVGKITKAHGVRGEVAVLVLSETPSRFSDGAALRLEDGRALTVGRTRTDRGRLLVTFEEVRDRETAKALTGAYLFISTADLPELPDGSWWPQQLEGCEVFTEDGRSLGTLSEVLATPANDVWVARAGDRETLVPALRDVVVSVDTAAGRIVVREDRI